MYNIFELLNNHQITGEIMKEIVFTVKKDIDVPVELDSLLPVKLQ
jgi:hypothetical protein